MTSSVAACDALRACILSDDHDSEAYYSALNEDDQNGWWLDLLDLADHVRPEVRRGLVSALPHICPDPPPALAVEMAIRLTTDDDQRVRDWACFVLGQQWTVVDTPELRDALAARLDDIDRDTRCEALFGLAARGDERALPRVRAALTRSRGNVWRLEMLAAGALGDPELHPFVLRHLDGWDDEDALVIDAVRRLTDPAGPGADVLRGVAELYRRRAHGEPDGDALTSWRLMNEMLELAPHRAWGFLAQVRARLAGDEAAIGELMSRSALAADLEPEESAGRDQSG